MRSYPLPAPLFSAAQRVMLYTMASRGRETYMMARYAGPAFELTLRQIQELPVANIPSDPHERMCR